jgi:hypothetical protein
VVDDEWNSEFESNSSKGERKEGRERGATTKLRLAGEWVDKSQETDCGVVNCAAFCVCAVLVV